MPTNKLQHYVPRALLRQFAADDNKKATNLWLPKLNKFISDAPIKGQCAKNYLYGKDLALETVFQEPERKFSEIIRKLVEHGCLGADDLSFLLFFWLLQKNRGIVTLTELKESFREVRSRAFDPIRDRDFLGEEWGIDQLAKMAFLQTRKLFAHVEDLECCILKAPRGSKFVTSDNPAVFANKFHDQSRHHGQPFGLASSGVYLALPLSPDYCFFAFDQNIYRLKYAVEKVALISSADCVCLNRIILVGCLKAIYFNDWSFRHEVERQLRGSVENIPKKNFFVNLASAVDDEISSGSTRFEVVDDASFRSSGRGLIHTRFVFPRLSQHPGFLKYRMRRRAFDTRSAAGHVRPNSLALREIAHHRLWE